MASLLQATFDSAHKQVPGEVPKVFTYILIVAVAFTAAVYVMITIERLHMHDWWRYVLYIVALLVVAGGLFGILHSQTQRIGIVCAVLVLSWRALAGRSEALRQQGGEMS